MQLLTFIASLGAFQGGVILLSILLRFRHKKNLPVSLLLIVFSLRLATIPTWDPDILIKIPWIYPLTAPLPFLFGPLLWWYLRELGSDSVNVPKPLFIHFIPYFLELSAVSCTVFCMNQTEFSLFVQDVFSGNPPLWLPLRNGLKVAVNLVYVFMSAGIAFGRNSKRLSSGKRLCARSLVVLPSVVLAAFAYVALPPSVTSGLAGGTVLPFFILSVTMAVLIYCISFLLIIAPEISFQETDRHAEPLCSDIECRRLLDMVSTRFSEGAFHNPDLVIRDLASEFDVHPNRLSFAVNRCCGTSFRTYLNRKRLDYFVDQINMGVHEYRSILEIAFDAGFPSKSTFNRFFKDEMGMTPSEFVNSAGRGENC